EDNVRINFNAAETGSRAGGKERISGTGGKDYNFTGPQKTNCATAVIMFNDAAHGNSGHHTGGNIGAFQRITHGEGVHDRSQHTHMVASDPVQTSSVQCGATKQVTASDNQTDLNADTYQLADFQCHFVQYPRINPEPLCPHQFLTTEFQQNPLVLLFSRSWHRLRLRKMGGRKNHGSLTAKRG